MSASSSGTRWQGPNRPAGDHRSWIVDRLVDITIVLWLFLLSEAIIPLMMLGGQDEFSDQQKLLLQNIFKPFILIAAGLFVLHFRGMMTILVRNPVLVLLVLWMWISSAWSMDPDVTLRRALLHSTFIILSCFVAYWYDFRQIITLLFLITVMVILASIYFIVLDPILGFNPDGRGARGVFMHKNGLGSFLVVGTAVAASALRLRIVPRFLGLTVLAASLALLVMANSTTALLAVVIMTAVYTLVKLSEKLPSRALAVLMSFAIAFLLFGTMLLIANIDEVFLLLGRDATLTGRNDVWAYALRMIQERNLLGYGYSAFWEIEPILSYVNDTLNWHITHAHSGFLQVWLELGLIGMGLLILFLIVAVFRAIFGTLPDHAAIFIIPLFIAMIISDLVETHLFVYKHFGWIVMLIFVFMTTPGLDRIRRQASGVLRPDTTPQSLQRPAAPDAPTATAATASN